MQHEHSVALAPMILSSVERLLMGYGLLDSFIYAMRESPVRLPGYPNLRHV